MLNYQRLFLLILASESSNLQSISGIFFFRLLFTPAISRSEARYYHPIFMCTQREPISFPTPGNQIVKSLGTWICVPAMIRG